MKNRSLLILEIVWIIVMAACILAGIRYAISPGGAKTALFFIMAGIAFIFALARHNQRKKKND